MHSSLAIILAGMIIGGCIVYAQYLDAYQVSATQGVNDVPVAWRINTHTGRLAACYPQKMENGKFKVNCE